MEKESKIAIFIPWIGIVFLLSTLASGAAFFVTGRDIFFPPTAILGGLTFLCFLYLAITSFPRIWNLMTESNLYQRVYRFNVFSHLMTLLVLPLLVNASLFMLLPGKENVYFILLFSFVWFLLWLFLNFHQNKKHGANVVTKDAFLGNPGIYLLTQIYLGTFLFLTIHFVFHDVFYWIDLSFLFYGITGLLFYESGCNYKSGVNQQQKNVAFYLLALGFVFIIFTAIVLSYGLYFNKGASFTYLASALVPYLNFFLGRRAVDKTTTDRIINSLTFTAITFIPFNLIQDLPPLNDSYLLPLLAVSLFTYRIQKEIPFKKDASKLESIFTTLLGLFTLGVIFFDLFQRPNFVAHNFGKMNYCLGLTALSILVQLKFKHFFSIDLLNPPKPVYRHLPYGSLGVILVGILLIAISHRTFNLDKATNIQLGATVSGGRQYLEDSYKETRVFGSREVGFNYYKITSLSYMKGQGENRYLQEVTSLFSSNPFNTHSVCSGESLDHIQSITFYLPKSNLPYSIKVAGLRISSHLSADDLVRLSQEKKSPIYTPSLDSNPMDGTSIVEVEDGKYLEILMQNNQLTRLTYFNDKCQSTKKNYSINAIFTPEIYSKVENLKDGEFVMKRKAKSFVDTKESKAKESFVGGEVIQSNFKIVEGNKSYYFYKGWIAEENLIPAKELLSLIAKSGLLDEKSTGKKPRDFIMPAGMEFYTNNNGYFTRILGQIAKSENLCASGKFDSSSNSLPNRYRFIAKVYEDQNEFIEFNSNMNPELGVLEHYLYNEIFKTAKEAYQTSIFNLRQPNIASLNRDFADDLKLWTNVAIMAAEPFFRAQLYAKFIVDFTLDLECHYNGYEGQGMGNEMSMVLVKKPFAEILAIEYTKPTFDSEVIDGKTYFLTTRNAEYDATILKGNALSTYCKEYGASASTPEDRQLYFSTLTKKQHTFYEDKPLCVK